MKNLQGSFLAGYVTILVQGNHPEYFFQSCSEKGIIVWNIKKESTSTCKGNIKLQDLDIAKQVKRQGTYKLTFTHKKGLPFLIKRLTGKKEILFGLLLSVMFIFFLSNVIWEVKITGVPTDIEEKISEQLDEYGIHQGTWTFSLDKPSVIQQKLISDVPELLWVGVHQKGTTFVLEGEEKTIVKEEEVEGPRNLVATKKGVIQKMYVSKGIPKVEVNDYVKPGDVLVSGKIQFDENNDDDDDEEDYELVAAEGEITAKTWYEVNVTVPLKANYTLLTGNRESNYHLKISGFEVPIWGFGSTDYEKTHRDREEKPLYFLNWKLPVKLVETTLSEKKFHEVKRSKEEAIKIGIRQAKNELSLRLGPEAEIISQNILHETTENGKVKLILYMTVEENIVKEESLTQGD